MVRNSKSLLVFVSVLLAALVLAGCPRENPVEQVLAARGQYTLKMVGLEIEDLDEGEAPEPEAAEPAEAVAVATEAVAMAVAAEAAEAEGEEVEEEPEAPRGPRSADVLVDLLVRFGGDGESLPGITAEVVHRDPLEQEKGRHLAWVETSGMGAGEERQVAVRLEVDNYEDGDEFSVEWNSFVPPEERGDYREFADAAP